MFTRFHAFRSTFGSDRRGVASIEYAFLAALMAVVIACSGWPLATREAQMLADLGAALNGGAARPGAASTWRAEARHNDQGGVGVVAGGGPVIEVGSPWRAW